MTEVEIETKSDSVNGVVGSVVENGDGKNSKSEPSLDKGPSDEDVTLTDKIGVAVAKQVEYYFGDFNLPRDKFMQPFVKQDEGWVSMDVLAKFNRLWNLCPNRAQILLALDRFGTGLLEIDAEKCRVRRSPSRPLPSSWKDVQDSVKDRAVYAKGYPLDATLDAIQNHLESTCGSTIHIQFRRHPVSKVFKGSIFATFEKKEDAEKFVTSDPTSEAALFNNETLTRLWREKYFETKKRPLASSSVNKAKESEEVAAPTIETVESSRDKIKSRLTLGCLLRLEGLTIPAASGAAPVADNKEETTASPDEVAQEPGDDDEEDTCTIEKEETEEEESRKSDNPLKDLVMGVKRMLLEVGYNSYVDLTLDGKALLVRLHEENTASLLWNLLCEKAADSIPTFKGSPLIGRVLSGEEEIDEWQRIFKSMDDLKSKNRGGGHSRGHSRGRGRGGYRGRGGNYGGRGGHKRHHNNDGGPSNKRARN